jgi:hypothetical protein
MQALLAIWIGCFIYIVIRLSVAAYNKWNDKTLTPPGMIDLIPWPIRLAGVLAFLFVLAPVVAGLDLRETIKTRGT